MATDIAQDTQAVDYSEVLRQETVGIRFSKRRMGLNKAYSKEQKMRAAEVFGAASSATYGGKKLIDSSHPKWKAVSAVIHRAESFWVGMTLDYPDTGVRLCNKNRIDYFEEKMAEFRAELEEKVRELDDAYEELLDQAREDLAELFNRSDYPMQLIGEFAIHHEYPSLAPPNYLLEASPELYQREADRVSRRFAEAVSIAENTFAQQLVGLIDHLKERLSPAKDGKKKVLHQSVLSNFQEFFKSFEQLDIGSNQQLTSLVNQAKDIANNADVEALRDSKNMREELTSRMEEIKKQIAVKDAPIRKMKVV